MAIIRINPKVYQKLKKRKSKYNSIPTFVDGIRFHSKKEANYYNDLKILQRSGEVVFFLRQIPFYLPEGDKYIADFLVFYSDGTFKVIDVKGFQTPIFKQKKMRVEYNYPITIHLV